MSSNVLCAKSLASARQEKLKPSHCDPLEEKAKVPKAIVPRHITTGDTVHICISCIKCGTSAVSNQENAFKKNMPSCRWDTAIRSVDQLETWMPLIEVAFGHQKALET